ncbi:MAG: hypothetical protein ACO1NM_03380 [Sphingobium phenoxybenzoativorans]
MPKATEIFVPSDFPTTTYVERQEEKLEKKVRDAVDTPKSPISISGPSKTGKTALVRNIVGDDNLIHIFGTQIEAPGDVWEAILNWMASPMSIATQTGSSEAITPTANTSAKIGIPGASISMGGGISTTTAANTNTTATQQNRGMSAVVREIANSDFIVFLDDFHYINRELQTSIGQQIKAGSEAGIRFCIASVPHRSDDVVRSNHELRGRTINIDTSFWNIDDLKKIGYQGFSALNCEISDNIIDRFARESCTSPQIMQALCLQLCFDLKIRDSLEFKKNFDISNDTIQDVLEQTSTRTDYTSLLKQMHAGPRVRGTERKEFSFRDDTQGDAYRAALLSLRSDPPAMEYNYADLLMRIADVCVGEKPVGSSITESLKQIAGFAEQIHPDQKIVEWDPDSASGTFAIIDPYFLFFLRSSDLMNTLAVKPE